MRFKVSTSLGGQLKGLPTVHFVIDLGLREEGERKRPSLKVQGFPCRRDGGIQEVLEGAEKEHARSVGAQALFHAWTAQSTDP